MTEEQKETKEIKEEEIQEDDFSREEKIEHYELLYILDMSFTTAETKPINERIAKLIAEHRGEITKKDDLGKLKLAYPIKQRSHGYYFLFEFDLPAANLKKLNDGLTLITDIIRFLVVKKKIKTEKEIAQEKSIQDKLAKRKEVAIEKIKAKKEEPKEKTTKETTDKKVSLEDLDKKLDELLDTDDIV